MSNKGRAVISSTHVDAHGTMMSKEALEQMAEIINGNRKIRIGIEHDMTLPPLGRFNNAKVEQGKNKEYYLIAEME